MIGLMMGSMMATLSMAAIAFDDEETPSAQLSKIRLDQSA
jgi:hypothetical protein